MSLEATCKICDEEFDMRHGTCPACAWRVKRVAQLEAKIKKAVTVLDAGEGPSGKVVRYAQEALGILLGE